MAQVIDSGLGVNTLIDSFDGKLIVGTSQDCTPILEDAKRRHLEGAHGSHELKHAARIPNVIIERYCNDTGITYGEFLRGKEHVRKLLNDPALAHFRIWPGRV